MKIYSRIAIVILTCLWQLAFSQEVKSFDFYDSIKNYDLSKLWHSDSVLNFDRIDDTILSEPLRIIFPEPIGFIGNKYERFYIHFLSVRKDKNNPYKYNVIGKTRVKNNICKFIGTITIDSADYYIDIDRMMPQFKRGSVVCHCIFYEDSNKSLNGYITGNLITDWVIYERHIYYDNIDGVADGYSNNQFQGVWKSYHSNDIKKCNWGDFRIPESKGLDIGAGEFSPEDKYLRNGWQSYWDAYSQGEPVKQKKALKIEKKPWWK